MKEIFLAQLEREIPATRKVLERIPEGKDDWRPHPKSMIATMVEQENLDLASGGPVPKKAGNKELLQLFDDSVAKARKALSGTSDDHLMKRWQLLLSGTVLAENARHVMIEDTFARLNDRPVPSIYGPTADEGWQK